MYCLSSIRNHSMRPICIGSCNPRIWRKACCTGGIGGLQAEDSEMFMFIAIAMQYVKKVTKLPSKEKKAHSLLFWQAPSHHKGELAAASIASGISSQRLFARHYIVIKKNWLGSNKFDLELLTS